MRYSLAAAKKGLHARIIAITSSSKCANGPVTRRLAVRVPAPTLSTGNSAPPFTLNSITDESSVVLALSKRRLYTYGQRYGLATPRTAAVRLGSGQANSAG